MSNATIVAAAFGEGSDLYSILGVERDASAAQLRKAYYRKSLQCHPDKISGKEAEFHALTVAYTILKNAESRAEYDESGELVDPDDDHHFGNGGGGGGGGGKEDSFNDMKRYFSSIFGTVTMNKIDAFSEKYKCSEEEEADVLKYYRMFKGHVGKMLQNVMLSTERDAQRWMEDYLQPAIASGQVPDYTKQLNKTLKQCLQKAIEEIDDDDDDDEDHMDDEATESEDDDSAPPPRKVAKQNPKSQTNKKNKPSTTKKARKTKAQWEAEQAEALIRKIRGKNNNSNSSSSSSSLALQLDATKRQKGFDSMVSGLAAKYGGAPKSKTKNKNNVDDCDPLDDAAFERIQAEIMKNKKKSKK
jgi:curved DNA-binding protein CbpA